MDICNWTLDRWVGVISLFVGIVIYFKQSSEQAKFEKFSTDTLNLVRKQGKHAQDHLIAVRQDLLRMFYEKSSDADRDYWHLKFRFEIWDTVGVTIVENEKMENFSLRIVGQVIDSFLESKDANGIQAFICEIVDISGSKVTEYEIGDVVVVFNSGKNYISKIYCGWIHDQKKYNFKITVLGKGNTQKIEKLASELKVFPRIKDTILS